MFASKMSDSFLQTFFDFYPEKFSVIRMHVGGGGGVIFRSEQKLPESKSREEMILVTLTNWLN